MPDVTLERDAEVGRIHAALESAAGGEGRLVLIEGPAGIGKTRLVEEARAAAKQHGFGRLKAIGDEPEQSLPWGVVSQMVERSILRYSGETRQQILEGPSGAAMRALDEGAMQDADDEVALARTLHKLWWVAADLSSDRPLLITVDDAQWADVPSLRFLAYLSRRLSDLSVALVVATRPVEVGDGPLAELAGDRFGDRLVPAPLTVDGIAALAGSVAPEVAEALHAASGGNPFFAAQLVVELERGGRALDDPASARAVGGLAPQTVARASLGRRGADETALAGAAAVLGARSDPALAATLAGLEPEPARLAADVLRHENVFTANSAELEFVHPVLRESVLAGVPAGWRGEMHAAAARALREAGATDDRVAGHLLNAPPGTFPDSGALLQAAAARAMVTGDAATAVAHLRKATLEGELTADLEADLGRALLRAGQPAEARDRLRSAAANTLDGRDRAERLALAAEATAAVDGAAIAAGELDAAISRWDGGAEDRLRLDARLALIRSFALEAMPGYSAQLDALADLGGASPDERVLLALLAQRALYEPRPHEEVRDLVLRALGEGALASENLQAWIIAIHALHATDAIAAVEAEIVAARSRVLPGGGPADFACIGAAVVAIAYRTGDLRRAETEAVAVTEALRMVDAGPVRDALRAIAARFTVHAQVEQGRPDDAAATLAAYDAKHRPASEPSIPVTRLRLARAALMLAREDPGSALAQAQRVGAEEQRAGTNTSVVPWRALAAVALARLGREDEGRALAAEHLDLARAFGAPSEVGAALRVSARLNAADRLELLEEAVATLEEAPTRLELAAALADYGETLGVARRRIDAREPLTRAIELAEAGGARPLAQRAADGLAALGDRPKRLMDYGIDELTAAERRVAHLAATGLTNREIAQELFVTPKTIENHLMRAYAKLGVKGRRELAGALTPA